MAVTINASTSNGLIQTADTSGQIQLQSNGTTAQTINSVTTTHAAGTVSNAPIVLTSGTNLTSATAGAVEYNGYSPYFTPFGTSRGAMPAYQYYALNSTSAGANVSTVQSIFGLTNGFTLQASTIYEFEMVVSFTKTAGSTSHTMGFGFGGTATLNNIYYQANGGDTSGGIAMIPGSTVLTWGASQTASNTVFTRAITNTSEFITAIIKGIVSVNAAGTFIPQYTLSAAPGGAYTTAIGSYFKIAPLAASGANVSIGNVS